MQTGAEWLGPGVEVGLEKKNKSNLLDSEMLSPANPGGGA